MERTAEHANSGVAERPASRLIEELSNDWKELYNQSLTEAIFDQQEAPENYEQQIHNQRMQKLFGPRFANVSFENYYVDDKNADQHFAFNVCKSYADNIKVMRKAQRNNLVLAGRSGTGKNHLAYSIAKSALAAGYNVEPVPFLHIMQEIKASYRKDSHDTERNIIDRYTAVDFLILEEIGVSYESQAEKIHFFDLLDGRYKYAKPTIIITNYSQEEFRAFIDFDGKERVWDRLQQTAVIVPFDWDSYRAL